MREVFKGQNLYNNPRLLYKFYPLSKEYALKYTFEDTDVFMFTPNVDKMDTEKWKNAICMEKWRIIALDGRIFYTSPIFFNDPFDTVLPNVPEQVPPQQTRKEIISVLKQIKRIKKSDEDRLLFAADFDSAVLMVIKSMGLNENAQAEVYSTIKKSIERYRDEIAIACFSEVNDSKLMWAHYADSYRGFCIEYDFSKTDDIRFRKGIGKVFYSDIRPKELDCDLEEYEKRVLYTKATCWSYEKEWRSVNILPYGLYSNKQYPIVDVSTCINAIYLGCNMPVEYQKEIVNCYRNSKVKVYRMKLKENEFGFEFEEYIEK